MIQEATAGLCLQAVLGTDKRNPNFTVYAEEERQQLHVYYGLELLQVLPDRPEHLAYKVMVGQLYNAGVRVRALQEAFGVDRKTMQRWGQALMQSDGQVFARVMAGRQQGRKLTPEIQAYIRMRWPELCARQERCYRQVIQREVASVFGVRLCGETLRGVFRELRLPPARGGVPSGASPEAVPTASAATSPEPALGVAGGEFGNAGPGTQAVGGVEKRETPGAEPEPPGTTVGAESALATSAAVTAVVGVVARPETPGTELPEPAGATAGAGAAAGPPSRSRQQSPAGAGAVGGDPRWCEHAGVLVFSL